MKGFECNNQLLSGIAGYSRNRLLRFGNTEDYASVVLKSKDVLKYQDTDISVYRAVVDGNRHNMEDTALIFMGRRITYRELIVQADRVSDILTSMNIRKGDIMVDSLKKLQDGMKIDSSSDDSGGYQIGEEIRKKIRQGINPYQ